MTLAGRFGRAGALSAALALVIAGCGGGSNATPGAATPPPSAGPSAGVPTSSPPASGSPASATPSGSRPPDASASATAPPPSAAPPSAGPGASPVPSAVPSAGPGEFVNPVLKGNFADPQVMEDGGTYYAYATGNLTYNIQVSTSPDLVHWSAPDEALPRLPLWQPSSKGLSWAPEVMRFGDRYVMYYTGRDVLKGKQCVTFATSATPTGPFVDESTAPLVCQYDLGGSIDPSPFADSDGTRYLLWKNDGNCCGLHTHLYIQPLGPDGTSLTGKATDTGEDNDRGWERNLVEGPTLLLHDGTYFLFYSANDYGSRNYAAGYATAKTVLGPYTDAAENPILVSKETAAGPGGQTVVADKDGDLWILYHAWDSSLVGDSVGGQRSMWLDELVFSGDKVAVDGPEVGPQPVP